MARSKEHQFTTKEKGDLHNTVSPLLEAAYVQMQELSKKKPDTTLSPNKVKMLNRLLADVKTILADEVSIKYLDLIEEAETLPHHSDIVLMLSQYSAALAVFRDQYYGYDNDKGEHCWYVAKRIK